LHTRFQPGRSGNPAGRPRISKTFQALIRELLSEEVSINENGSISVMLREQFILKQIMHKAALSDRRFQTLLTTRAALLDVASHRDRRRPENIIEDVRKSLLGDP
jgi:hypothetical protein